MVAKFVCQNAHAKQLLIEKRKTKFSLCYFKNGCKNATVFLFKKVQKTKKLKMGIDFGYLNSL